MGNARDEFGAYKNVQIPNARILSRKKALEFAPGKIVLLASPLTNLFYSGFDLISTYRDHRFMKTVKKVCLQLKMAIVS